MILNLNTNNNWHSINVIADRGNSDVNIVQPTAK